MKSGFTLIELLVVIVLMAILASVAMPRFMGSGDFEGPAFANELASAARYAQKMALISGCPVRLVIPNATTYQLRQPQNPPGATCDAVFTRPVLHPGTGNAFDGSTPPGVAIGGVPPTLTIEFNARGAATVNGVVADASIPVGGQTLTILAPSGYVDLQ